MVENKTMLFFRNSGTHPFGFVWSMKDRRIDATHKERRTRGLKNSKRDRNYFLSDSMTNFSRVSVDFQLELFTGTND